MSVIKHTRNSHVGALQKSWKAAENFFPIYIQCKGSSCLTFLCCFFFCCCSVVVGVHARGGLPKGEKRCFGTCDNLFSGSLHMAAGAISSLFSLQENCMQMWPSVKLPSSLQFGTVCSVFFLHVTKWWCATSRLRRFTGHWVFTIRELQFACRVLQQDYQMCSVMLIYSPFVIGKYCKKRLPFLHCNNNNVWHQRPTLPREICRKLCAFVCFSLAPLWNIF